MYIDKLPESLLTLIGHHNELYEMHFLTDNLTLINLGHNKI
jgi:hypothetical protein